MFISKLKSPFTFSDWVNYITFCFYDGIVLFIAAQRLNKVCNGDASYGFVYPLDGTIFIPF